MTSNTNFNIRRPVQMTWIGHKCYNNVKKSYISPGNFFILLDLVMVFSISVSQWWVEFNDQLSWLFTYRFKTFYLICRKHPNPPQNLCYSHSLIFHISGSLESVSKQPTRLIVELNSSLWHIIVTQVMNVCFKIQCYFCFLQSGLYL